jgi:hypothetical protein
VSKDPIGLASGDTNPYSYVFNQPTSLVDPMGTKPGNSRGGCGSGNSFAAGTRVLMADGSTRPIEQVRVGDRVAAADPGTGERGARTVTATIVGDGEKALVDVRVGDGAVITATDGHPVWVDDDGRADTSAGRWIDARELRKGQWLKTSDGRLVQVAGVQARVQHARVYNLTVDDLHTYHVVAGSTSVLVHNSSCESLEDIADSLPARKLSGQTTGQIVRDNGNGTWTRLGTRVTSGSQNDPISAQVNRALTASPAIRNPATRGLQIRGYYEFKSSTHVEGRVAYLQSLRPDVKLAHVVINNSSGPCGICRGEVGALLRQDQVLRVHYRDAHGNMTYMDIKGRLPVP